MTRHKLLSTFFLLAIAAPPLLLSSSASAADPSPVPGECVDIALSDLLPCSDYVRNGGNATKPSNECCKGVSSFVKKDPSCTCKLLAHSSLAASFHINVTRAMILHARCNVSLDLGQCGGPPSAAPVGSFSPHPIRSAPVRVPDDNRSYSNGGKPTRKKTGVIAAATAVPLLLVLATAACCFILRKSKPAKGKDDLERKINSNSGTSSHVHNMGTSGFPTTSSLSVEDPPLLHQHDQTRDDEELDDKGPRRIPFEELLVATDNFDESRRLGKGASGEVYHGFLRELNREAAIKRIVKYSERGEKEFMAEVKTISRLRHRNLVQLIGCCRQGRELLIVYEFMPNGSLDHQLFERRDKSLPWPVRYKIALGVASALQYLHEELDQWIVHRDIKSSNILLDGQFDAKLGDFGLAREAEHGSPLLSTVMAGTVAYMAPEYFATGKANKETDVYSFGIVELELACGRRAVEPREKGREMLLNWCRELYEKGAMVDAVDKKLGTAFDEREAERMLKVGLWCAHPDARCRPSLRQAVAALMFEMAVPDLSMMNPYPPSLPTHEYNLSSTYEHSTTSVSASSFQISPASVDRQH